MRSFAGKRVFITGGSSGIGLAAAEKLARHGASVAIFARRLQPLELALDGLQAKSCRVGQRFYAQVLDVGDGPLVREVMARAVAEFGPPDWLITAAGVGAAGLFGDVGDDAFDEVIRTNLHGTRYCARALLPHLPGSGGGIVLVGSLAGFLPVYGYGAYCASKFALTGLARCLRDELRPRGLGVSLFCPPEVDTPFLAAEAPALPPATRALKLMAGRIGPGRAAAAMLHGAARGRFLIIPGFAAKAVYGLNKLMPGWLGRLATDMIVRRHQGRRAAAGA